VRIVVDTNVLVSAALKDSSWPASTVRWIEKYGDLLKTDATEREAFLVLERPYIAAKIPPLFLTNLRLLFASAEQVTVTERVTECRDPNDDKFLELAVNGHADVIVSGDADLLVLDRFRGIPIITPAAFGHARVI